MATTSRVIKTYTWKQFDEDCEKIAEWAKDKNLTAIYGIPRGGLILAVKLSHLLNLPVILGRDDVTNSTLVVDDIADSGGTLERLLGSISAKPLIASLYAAKDAKVKSDFYVREKTKWVIFPWETKLSSRYDKTEF